jgi:putative oxidoreductase
LSLSLKPLLLRLFEVILGGLFGYAGFIKLLSPDEFAGAVLAYKLLPVFLAGLVAAGLPWLEVAAGLFLVLGLKRRSCLIILGFLTTGFLLVMAITMARGLQIDCGCGLFSGREVGLVPILEDIFIFLWAAGLYYGELVMARGLPQIQAQTDADQPMATKN